MKYLRQKIREFKYKLKFLAKNSKTELNYVVNSNVNKKLKSLMNLYGSDKGNNNNHHNYADFYSEIFHNKRYEIKNFLEIGLGTNNLDVLSNMGVSGKPLASIRAWRDYFLNAQIYGADIDKNILANEERIKTFFVDQTNSESVKNLYKQIGDVKFDVILEDGLHEFNANICCFENSIDRVADNGLYIIEDVYYKDKKKFINYFNKTKYVFSVVDIHHDKNIANNCLVIIRKNYE
tara:strand:+ start:140 stop:844 length:705 start_codon:yes stop_codon:yes gene_type:complete